MFAIRCKKEPPPSKQSEIFPGPNLSKLFNLQALPSRSGSSCQTALTTARADGSNPTTKSTSPDDNHTSCVKDTREDSPVSSLLRIKCWALHGVGDLPASKQGG